MLHRSPRMSTVKTTPAWCYYSCCCSCTRVRTALSTLYCLPCSLSLILLTFSVIPSLGVSSKRRPLAEMVAISLSLSHSATSSCVASFSRRSPLSNDCHTRCPLCNTACHSIMQYSAASPYTQCVAPVHLRTSIWPCRSWRCVSSLTIAQSLSIANALHIRENC